jgi:hypothetical protein
MNIVVCIKAMVGKSDKKFEHIPVIIEKEYNNMEYIPRIGETIWIDEVACHVKIVDVNHNLERKSIYIQMEPTFVKDAFSANKCMKQAGYDQDTANRILWAWYNSGPITTVFTNGVKISCTGGAKILDDVAIVVETSDNPFDD